MAEPAAPRHWLRRIGDLLLALLLLVPALWLVVAGHFLATCPGGSDWLGWSLLVVAVLPIMEPWTLAVWLALAIALASLRPFSGGRRFWVILAGVMLAGLALALALGMAEYLLGLRDSCSIGGWR